jgi:hypothetical protein
VFAIWAHIIFQKYPSSRRGKVYLRDITSYLGPSPKAAGFADVSPKLWHAKGWHSANILVIICFRQKPSKVS